MDYLLAYWDQAHFAVNGLVFLNLFGALLLGLAVGYERSYHGRAAGMRTYGLVCMASAAATAAIGYPEFWFGVSKRVSAVVEVSHVVQGVLTGIGFLGAGVIMKEGLSISGLTTAASIWVTSVVGILIGLGFYAAAICLAGLSAALMIWVSKLEAMLPSRHAIALMLRFGQDCKPNLEHLRQFLLERGYQIASGSMAISYDEGKPKWQFVAIALSKRSGMPLALLGADLQHFDGVDSLQVVHARN
ncbi:MgtC/SapB family protein [Massilia sp. W12]|uniref:MgtC/SapB family protein n=1 Tax=Massilia sp. W12 TaxID=3126507 RepID=UPI0030D294E5